MPDPKPNPPLPLIEYAGVGDIVHWYAGGDVTLTPLVGIVIEKSPGGGPGGANLTVATFTGSGFGIQEGVLHMSSPRCRGNAAGGWRHRPLEFVLRQFLVSAGAVRWDGDESYVADGSFDAATFGEALRGLVFPTRELKATPQAPPGGEKPK